MTSIEAIFPQIGACKIVPCAMPQMKGPTDVLIAAEASLISPGTELSIFTGRHTNLQKPNPIWPRFPFRPGYSLVGRVLQCGAAVRDIAAGQRVFARAAHASHVVVPVEDVTPLPDAVTAESGTILELGAIALNGVRQARIEAGHRVCVFGLGLVGLLAARMARLCGATRVVAIDLSPARRDLAAAMGAHATIDPSVDDVATTVRASLGGDLADVVIEATGVPTVVITAQRCARDEGRIVLLGSPHGTVEADFYAHVHRRGLTLVGAHIGLSQHPATHASPWNLHANHRTVMEWLAGGDLDVRPLLVRTVKPDELHAGYARLAAGSMAAPGVIVDWTCVAEQRI